ncbi:hypothetical protein [Anoxynatronum sibiricum]|uniref:Uncharacterized protein n=1 Tax=Anoxynatronum sibiricum TaxID=210623 RepID=A0ABU9VWA5_9CLOT
MEFKVLSEYKIVDGYIVGFAPVVSSYDPESSNFGDDVFSEFTKIKDDKSLLKFASRYGLIGINQRHSAAPSDNESLRVFDEVVSLLSDEERRLLIIGEKGIMSYDSIDRIMEEVEYMRRVKEVIKNPEAYPDRTKEIESLARLNVEEYKRQRHYISRDKAASVISNKIKGRSISTVLKYNKRTNEYRYTPERDYTHLLPAIWFKLYSSVIEEKKDLKECPVCHQLHAGRGACCPPAPGEEVSPCTHTNKIREYRRRKREATKEAAQE